METNILFGVATDVFFCYFSLLTLVAPNTLWTKKLLQDTPRVDIELGVRYFCMFMRLTLGIFSLKFCRQMELYN